MKGKRRPLKSYTLRELLAIAQKYENKTDFHKYDRNAWRAANELGYYNKCTIHMIENQKPKGYWTKELCRLEAVKYKGRYEFCLKGSPAYQAAQEKGWLNEICSHMVSARKKNGYWREGINLILEAMKYNSRTEFAEGSPGAYTAAQNMNVLDQICVHMSRLGNAKNKIVYAWEFPDQSVYVGLTFNMADRERHRSSCDTDAVTKYRKETNLIPVLSFKTKLLPIEEAVKKEQEFVKWYERKGWNILNRMQTGAVGGNIIVWTKPNCIKVASKCKTRKEFYEQYTSAYDSARKNKWLADCCRHFNSQRKSYRYWTEKNIQRVALRCETRVEFEEKYGSAYNAAMKKGILDKVCRHMAYIKRPNGYWTYEKIIEFAKECISKKDFIRKHRNAYQSARTRQWLGRLYKEMKWGYAK